MHPRRQTHGRAQSESSFPLGRSGVSLPPSRPMSTDTCILYSSDAHIVWESAAECPHFNASPVVFPLSFNTRGVGCSESCGEGNRVEGRAPDTPCSHHRSRSHGAVGERKSNCIRACRPVSCCARISSVRAKLPSFCLAGGSKKACSTRTLAHSVAYGLVLVLAAIGLVALVWNLQSRSHEEIAQRWELSATLAHTGSSSSTSGSHSFGLMTATVLYSASSDSILSDNGGSCSLASMPMATFTAPWMTHFQPIYFDKPRMNFSHLPYVEGRPPFDYVLHQAVPEVCLQQQQSQFPSLAVPLLATAASSSSSVLCPASVVSAAESAFACPVGDASSAPPILSIITPVYNTPARLFNVTQTVMRGSFQHFEWIVINDGSTSNDTQRNVLDLFRKAEAGSVYADPRIVFIDLSQNIGLPAARNMAARRARGRFLLFADADDLFEPTYVEKCVLFLHFHPHHAVCGAWSYSFGLEGKEFAYDNPGFARGADNLSGNHLMSMQVIRKTAFELVGGYDERLRTGMEDWDLWLHLLSVGEWGHTIPEYLFWYRASARDRWAAIHSKAKFQQFKDGLAEKYKQMYHRHLVLKENIVPSKLALDRDDMAPVTAEPPLFNRLHRRTVAREDVRLVTGAMLSTACPSSSSPSAPLPPRPRLVLLTHFSVMGGGEKFNARVLREFAARGWEVTLVLFTPEELDNSILPEFRAVTNDIFVLPNFLLSPSNYAPFLVYLFHSRRPDVVFLASSEEAYLSLEYVQSFSRHFAPEMIVVDYNHMEHADWKSGGYPRYTLQNEEWIDRSLFCTDSVRRWVTDRGYPAHRTAVVYIGAEINERREQVRRLQKEKEELAAAARANSTTTSKGQAQGTANDAQKPSPVPSHSVLALSASSAKATPEAAASDGASSLSLRDETLRAQTRAELGVSPSTIVVLYIARIAPVKLPHVVGDVIIALHGKAAHATSVPAGGATNFHFLILGDGPEREPLEHRLSSSPAHAWVTFAGMVTDPDRMHAYLSAGDIVFLPSKLEGLSMSLMDGMSYGLVPISVRVGGQAELIRNEREGFLIAYDGRDNNAHMSVQFTELMQRLAASPALLRQLAAAALARIQHYSTESMMEGLQREFCVAFRQKEYLHRKRVREEEGWVAARASARHFQSSPMHTLCPTLEEPIMRPRSAAVAAADAHSVGNSLASNGRSASTVDLSAAAPLVSSQKEQLVPLSLTADDKLPAAGHESSSISSTGSPLSRSSAAAPSSRLSPSFASLLESARIKASFLRMQAVAQENWQASLQQRGPSHSLSLRTALPLHLLSAHFERGLSLLSAAFPTELQLSSGQPEARTLHVHLLLMASAPITDSWVIFLHFRPIASASAPVAAAAPSKTAAPGAAAAASPPPPVAGPPATEFLGDHLPLRAGAVHPTTEWAAGEILLDQICIRVPDTSGVGTYEVLFGFWRQDSPTWERLPLAPQLHTAQQTGTHLNFEQRAVRLGVITLT